MSECNIHQTQRSRGQLSCFDRERVLSENRRGFVWCCDEQCVCPFWPKWKHTVHMLLWSVTQSPGNTHTHTHTHLPVPRQEDTGPRNKAYPFSTELESAKRLEDDVLNNLITPNKEDAASFKKKKKRVLPLTQKGFLKASTSAQQVQNNYDRLHELWECHRSCYTLLHLSHRTWLKPTFTFPASRYGRFAL